METKRLTSIRLSTEAKRLVELLAQKLSVSQAAVFELALREYAKREGITARGADIALHYATGVNSVSQE